jgi:type IV secretory pathway ATPase VirB11/archaellum biosynthesis ATPase
MPELTLDDLVANHTMSPAMAATLRRAVEAHRSYLVIALPRLAGKSTVGKAMLAVARQKKRPIRELGEHGTDVDALAREARGGYLYVPEVSRYPVTDGYVWGAPVRAAFAAIKDGTALSTALHADSAEDALRILRANRVPPDDLRRLDLIVHIRSLGEWQNPTRRVVADVSELVDGELRLLHRWDEARDRFEEVAKPTAV